jgi:hypothetical protein
VIDPGSHELLNRFIGIGRYTFTDPLQKRFLQLSSVRYVVTQRPIVPTSELATIVIKQNQGRLLPGRGHYIELRAFTIGGRAKMVLFEHPPYERLPFRTDIRKGRDTLYFSLGMDPSIYKACGDGVEFRLEAKDQTGRIDFLYSRYIDPKHNASEQKWIPAVVDLTRYSGQEVELLFTTTPGPKGDTCADWAGWGDLRFNDRSEPAIEFERVYDAEATVYRFSDRLLPRAAIFHQVEIAKDDDAALAVLTRPDFDIFQTAVVSSAALSAEQRAVLVSLNRLSRSQVSAARVVSRDSQFVQLEATLDRPGLLVLNDTDYPGWKAYVDGRPSASFAANYLFRGLILESGRHVVEFRYEPRSFAAGAAISILTLVSAAAAGLLSRKRTRVNSDVV